MSTQTNVCVKYNVDSNLYIVVLALGLQNENEILSWKILSEKYF